MIHVVCSESIPHAHREDEGGLATTGLMLDLAAMMFLDISLG